MSNESARNGEFGYITISYTIFDFLLKNWRIGNDWFDISLERAELHGFFKLELLSGSINLENNIKGGLFGW